MDDFMELVRAGRIAEAKALVEEARSKVTNSPTRISAKAGKPAKFYRGNKRVEQNPDGTWQVIPPTKR